MGAWGLWTIDMRHYGRDRMPSTEYVATSYYEHRLFTLETLVVGHGAVPREEIETRVAALRGR
jgi:nitrile hydratase